MEANITIHSVIESPEGAAPERTEARVRGELSFDGNTARLIWRECGEGGEVNSTLTVLDSEVSVARRGAIESTLVFREGERAESLYKLGQYSFDMSVTARRVRCSLGEDSLSVTVIYDMVLGGAEQLVKMKIRAEARAEDADD